MLGQVIDVQGHDRWLYKDHGSLVVATHSGAEVGRVAFDDIAAVLVYENGSRESTSVLAELARRSIPLVVCDAKYLPTATLLPIAANYATSQRIEAQLNASVPMRKQAWKQVVQSKITMQALVLESLESPERRLNGLVAQVRSGDPTNIEAQAASIYWRALFGPRFRRRRNNCDDPNPLLNYGYTLIRAATARAIAATGLHPSVGIFHRGPFNSMRLADDMMEPYRPVVDLVVWSLFEAGVTVVDKRAKSNLVRILYTDVLTPAGVSPLAIAILRSVRSLDALYRGDAKQLELPGVHFKTSLCNFMEVQDHERNVGLQDHVVDSPV